MTGGEGTVVPTCPACSGSDASWEILSPVTAEDRVRFDASGLTELGLFAPESGVEPLGRPVIRCSDCGTTATEEVGESVLRAVVMVTRPHRTPGDA